MGQVMKRYSFDEIYEEMYEEVDGTYVKYTDISCVHCKRRGSGPTECIYRQFGMTACSKCEPEVMP